MQWLVVSGWCLVVIVPTLLRGNASYDAPASPPAPCPATKTQERHKAAFPRRSVGTIKQVRMETRPPCQEPHFWASCPLAGAVREPPLQRTFQRGDDHQTLWEIALISHQRLRRGGASNSDRPSVTCAFSGGSAAEKPAAAMAASRPST